MSDQAVSLKLVRVKCVDETGGSLVERFGNDEIWFAGNAVDATGTRHKLPPFEVYPHFDDGDIKEFRPPKPIFSLAVPGGGTFPKSCFAILLLAEKDNGNLQDAFDDAIKDMDKIIVECFRPGECNGDISDKLNPILAGWNDDVFPAQLVSLSITSDDFRWGDGTKMSPETTVEFRGHEGVYYLVYYWEIETLAGESPFRDPRRDHPMVGGGIFHS
jgi:hypothetical protein